MSIQASSWVWDLDLRPTLKLTALALADWADPTGYCWPQQTTIATKTGQAESTVRAHISEMVELGLLVKVKRRRAKNGALRGWEYHMRIGSSVSSPEQEALPLAGEQNHESLPLAGERSRPLAGERSSSTRHLDTPVLLAGDAGGGVVDTHTMTHAEAFDLICEVCGVSPEDVKASGGGYVGVNAKLLRDLRTTPAIVRGKAAAFHAKYGTLDDRKRPVPANLTPSALLKHWPALDAIGVEDVRGTCGCGQLLGPGHREIMCVKG